MKNKGILNDISRLSMLMDYYELTMGNGFLKNGLSDTIAYYDAYFRKVPDEGGFAIAAGIEQLVEFLQNIKFTESDIDYLRKKGDFSEEFLDYLLNFKFSCDVWAVPEGTPVFPGEPLVTIRGPVIQAQLIETMVLVYINHQSLIATKANRIVRAAEGRAVLEFGSRRAQGPDGAVLGSRAAFIGGCKGTACTLGDIEYGIPAGGTMAHSWIQLFDSEYEAFEAYARAYPNNCTLLVDTFNVLKSGVPNAIKAFDNVLKPMGARPAGIRIDSGDITYLSKQARKMLDAAGYSDCKIVVSNSLDEYIISNLIAQGAKIDIFGVGERLITAKSDPVFGGVYKLCAIEKNGEMVPKIKISENIGKITTPGFKQLWRLYDNSNGKAIADVITLFDEVIDETKDYEIFDPEHTWKRRRIKNFTARRLMEKVFDKGNCIFKYRTITEVKDYCEKEISNLWDEVLRFENPHQYYVDLSEKLWDMKHKLLEEQSNFN